MDLNLIESKLQEIVNKAHTNHKKRNIIRHNDKFKLSCPYCLDSSKNAYNYRGNLNGALFFRCFNCDRQTHFLQMCKDFSIDISLDKRVELNDYIHNNISKREQHEDNYIETSISKLVSLDDISVYLNSGEFNITNFKPIEKNSTIERYLLQRGIYNGNLTNIYQAEYWKSSDRKEPIICLLNRKGNNVLGMQIRNLKDGKLRFFKIYNFETIHKWVNTEDKWLEESEYLSYNRLSLYFGILNVSFEKKITIFEGYLDSLFYPNAIGVVGVNTPTTFLECNGLDIQYFFDNDEAGWLKSDEKLKEGFSVFLWNKMFDWVIKKKNSDDPFLMKNRLDKIKDLNKLSTLIKNAYTELEMENFFSKDEFDSIWVPKVKKWKSPRQYFK